MGDAVDDEDGKADEEDGDGRRLQDKGGGRKTARVHRQMFQWGDEGINQGDGIPFCDLHRVTS